MAHGVLIGFHLALQVQRHQCSKGFLKGFAGTYGLSVFRIDAVCIWLRSISR
jgi:hypothetical protein